MGGAGGLDASVDAPPDAAALPLLNAWHIPINAEPATVTMRNPRFPAAAGTVYIYVGVQPKGSIIGATLYWWWSGETSPHQKAFSFDSNQGSNEYWVMAFTMPPRPVGTFRYYIELQPSDAASHAVTYLYGTDTSTTKASSPVQAQASPYKPDVRLPAAGGDAGFAEIVITEAMINAAGSNETPKEWFEVYCAASVPVTLDGCKVGDSNSLVTIAAPELILWPGVYAVLGATADSANMGGFVPDHAYGDGLIAFNNALPGDQLRVLLPDDSVLDQVTYGSNWNAGTYGTDGHSMQLSIALDSLKNDDPAQWCMSQRTYGLGTSFGTPQAASDGCAP